MAQEGNAERSENARLQQKLTGVESLLGELYEFAIRANDGQDPASDTSWKTYEYMAVLAKVVQALRKPKG